MQGWRQWETASKAEWGAAVERESVIRSLAEEERLTNCGGNLIMSSFFGENG